MDDINYFFFQDLEDILRGAHFYASGGGGAYANGVQLLAETRAILEARGEPGLRYLQPGKDLPDTVWSPFVGAVGSPAKYLSEGFSVSPAKALLAHQQAMGNKLSDTEFRFSAVTAIETGTITYGMTMLLAAQQQLALIDADGCGRAVPVLPMVGPALAETGPALSPVTLVSEADHLAGGAELTIDTRDTANLNAMLHGIISHDDGFDQRSALSCYATPGQQMNAEHPQFMMPAALSRSLKLGRILRDQQNCEQTMIKAVLAETSGQHLCRAEVTQVAAETRHGFDYLRVDLTDEQLRRYVIHVENESLIMQQDTGGILQPLAMAPDLICYLCSDGSTITNAELTQALSEKRSNGEGLILNVFAVPAPAHMDTEAMRQLCLAELAAMGCYSGGYISAFDRATDAEGYAPDLAAIISQQHSTPSSPITQSSQTTMEVSS